MGQGFGLGPAVFLKFVFDAIAFMAFRMSRRISFHVLSSWNSFATCELIFLVTDCRVTYCALLIAAYFMFHLRIAITHCTFHMVTYMLQNIHTTLLLHTLPYTSLRFITFLLVDQPATPACTVMIGITAFVLDRDTPGLSIGKKEWLELGGCRL